MEQIIVYINQENQLVEIFPNPACGLTIEQIALKDVPAGVAYKFMNHQDIPRDQTFRDAWTVDMSNPDGCGADYGIGSDRAVDGWNEDGTPIIRGEA